MKLPFFKRFRFARFESLTVLTFLILFASALILYTKTAKAQVPLGNQDCNQTASPEFHTFRPYQADPCNDNARDLALFCGNDLVLQDSITVGRNQADYCQRISPTEEECFFSVTKDLDIAIDVSGAEFPIMGNTEGLENNIGIINSQDQTTPEQIDDFKKVNEYVSWYLNGISNAPEYGGLDASSPEDLNKIVNLSGPLKRLLPHRKQRDAIEETIQEAGRTRHDQVVGCHSGDNLVECYSGAGGQEIRLSDFDSRIPPKEEGYPTFDEWWIAYQQWRGFICGNIGFLNTFICIDDPGRPNFWANLFFQIPQSSTEDRKGLVEVLQPVIQPTSPNMTITLNTLSTTPANLFFAHQEESRTLADILQSTFVPKGEQKTGPVSQVSPAEYCDLTQVRSNPGDDLFAGEIRVLANYTADFSCGFDTGGSEEPASPICYFATGGLGECVPSGWGCNPSMGSMDCDDVYGSGYKCGRNCSPPNQTCTKTASVILNTVTETPLTDDIWSRLVAGPMGVFKRIFPKVEVGAPIEGILDIPAATGVSFSATLNGNPAPLYAGNPSNQRSALELYFPHVGGIHEYFLKCIQQALRPQGFGEGCLSGAPGTQAAQVDCDPNVPDSAIPATYRGGFKTNYITMVNQWIAGCEGPENNLADECYNDTVKRSAEAGVNPAFTLSIWQAESGASNYCYRGATTKDFGVNDQSIATNWGEQLARFLTLPFSGNYAFCASQPGWPTNDMYAFLSLFGPEGCVPGSTGTHDRIRGVWQLVTGNCTSGNDFSINWPTDSNCP